MEYSIIKSPNLTLTEAILNVHTTLKDNRPCHVWCPPGGKAPYPNENKNKTKFFSSG